MEIYQLTLTISGTNLQVEEVLKNTSDSLTAFNTIFLRENYGYGVISFRHPNIFSRVHMGFSFDEVFVNFIEKNKDLFLKSGVEDISLFTEFYYSDEQCNFEILTTDLLSRLTKIGIKFGLPVSVYKMKKSKIEELMRN